MHATGLTDGRFGVVDDETSEIVRFFDTFVQAQVYALAGQQLSEQEARTFMAKQDTAKAIVRTVQSLATATDTAGDLEKEYFDVAGAGWVDEDVAAIGITAAQLTACITTLQQFAKLMTAQATTPLDNTATLNQVRRVQT